LFIRFAGRIFHFTMSINLRKNYSDSILKTGTFNRKFGNNYKN